MQTDHPVILEPARELPVAERVDVLVAGGGPAGVAAAIAAARGGAKTLLVETAGALGGTWTVALQTHATCFHDGRRVVVNGIPLEIIRRLHALGAAEDPVAKVRERPACFWVAFDAELMKCVLDEMVAESGARVLFHTTCAEAIRAPGQVDGVVIESKTGRQAILSKITIDCTGDADVAHFAGARTAKGRATDGKCQPVTTTFLLGGVDMDQAVAFACGQTEEFRRREKEARERGELNIPNSLHLGAPMLSAGVSYHNVTRILDVDATDAASLSRAEAEGRRQVREVIAFYRRYVPGFERCELLKMGAAVGLRESRRIVGEYTLSLEDVLQARKFPDGVARHAYYVDIHNPDGPGLEGLSNQHPRPPVGDYYEIPYRCLIPQGMNRLLAAGRCISASREALGSTRTTVCCAALGEAAGTAAALAAKGDGDLRAVDGRNLKRCLLDASVDGSV